MTTSFFGDMFDNPCAYQTTFSAKKKRTEYEGSECEGSECEGSDYNDSEYERSEHGQNNLFTIALDRYKEEQRMGGSALHHYI